MFGGSVCVDGNKRSKVFRKLRGVFSSLWASPQQQGSSAIRFWCWRLVLPLHRPEMNAVGDPENWMKGGGGGTCEGRCFHPLLLEASLSILTLFIHGLIVLDWRVQFALCEWSFQPFRCNLSNGCRFRFVLVFDNFLHFRLYCRCYSFP